MSTEFYLSGVTNCMKCNNFLTEYNQCVNCNKLLCLECIKNKDKCPLCYHSPFEYTNNIFVNRIIYNNKLICKFCKGTFNYKNLQTHGCTFPIFKCKFCKYQNRNENEFLKHINQGHREELIEMFCDK